MSDVFLLIPVIMMLPLGLRIKDIFFGRISIKSFKENSRENNAIIILGLIGFILSLIMY